MKKKADESSIGASRDERETEGKMDSLYIVMPAYNEEANIEKTVREWIPLLQGKDPASRLLIADAGSTDRTHAILLELQQEFSRLEILTDSDRQHGPKLMALYACAIERKADYIFQTDSDGQTLPGEFPAFWAKRRKYDALLGNRTVREDGRSRAFVEKVVCLLLLLIFRVNVPDANAPFRLMRSDLVKKYLHRMPADYNLPNIMLTVYFARYREKLAFRRITFRPRGGGKNSINMKKIIRIGWKALGDFRRFRKDM